MQTNTGLFDLSGRVALVTGGSRGLGRSMALGLATAGADVVVVSRKQEACEAVAAEIEKTTGRRALAVGCHMGNWDEIDALVEKAYDHFGRIHVLVNNAGTAPTYPDVASISEVLYDKILAVNLKGPFRLSALVGTRMVADGGGSIINVSSIAGIKASPNVSGYCATKGGVRLFTKSVALECAAAKDGVRVNSLHPGITETAIWDTLIGTVEDGSNGGRERGPTLDKLTERAVPLGYKAAPEDIANGILWLASDESRYVTGTELVIDGGRSIG